MQIVLKEPDKFYFGNFLWIPKSKVPEEIIKNKLEFTLKSYNNLKNVTIKFWHDTGTHYRVPRYFYYEGLENEEVIDITPNNYQQLILEDRITSFLDKKQEMAWNYLSQADEGIINMACGRGKSILALKKAIQNKGPFLIIVYQTTTIPQWMNFINRFTDYNGKIGEVRAEKEDWDPPIVVASAHTLFRRNYLEPEITHKFKTVIFDEVHHYAAPILKTLLPVFFGKRFGLSATIKREDGLEPVIQYHIGPIIYSDLYQPIKPEIIFVTSPVFISLRNSRFYDYYGQLSIPKIITFLSKLSERNNLIIEEVLKLYSHGHKVLILSHVKKHVVHLAKQLETAGAAFITGDTPQKHRLEIIKKHQIICATLNIAKEALDVPEISAVLFATPLKSWNTFQQSMGRALRVFENKKPPKVVVIYDINVKPVMGMIRNLMVRLREHNFEYKIAYKNKMEIVNV